MLRRLSLLACACAAACLVMSVQAGEEAAGEKFAAKCPVSGADAKKDQSTAYAEKEVYFCCEKCKAAFVADNAKFATKANHQLVATKQFEQTKCPLSGGPLNKDQSVTINDIKVTFCCDKCQGKAAAASADDQLAMVFGADAFKKGFTAIKKKE